jgi:hypothetical protein
MSPLFTYICDIPATFGRVTAMTTYRDIIVMVGEFGGVLTLEDDGYQNYRLREVKSMPSPI